MKGNKGESSELHARLEGLALCGQRIDEWIDGEKSSTRILSAVEWPGRGPNGEEVWNIYRPVQKTRGGWVIERTEPDGTISHVPCAGFVRWREWLLQQLKKEKEEKMKIIVLPLKFESLLHGLGTFSMKAASRDKLELGFIFVGERRSDSLRMSVKSRFGANPTIANASGKMKVKYEVELTNPSISPVRTGHPSVVCKQFKSMTAVSTTMDAVVAEYGFAAVQQFAAVNAVWRMFGMPRKRLRSRMLELLSLCSKHEALVAQQEGRPVRFTERQLRRTILSVAKYFYIRGSGGSCGKSKLAFPPGILTVRRDGGLEVRRLINDEAFDAYILDHCYFETAKLGRYAEDGFKLVFEDGKWYYTDVLQMRESVGSKPWHQEVEGS